MFENTQSIDDWKWIFRCLTFHVLCLNKCIVLSVWKPKEFGTSQRYDLTSTLPYEMIKLFGKNVDLLFEEIVEM